MCNGTKAITGSPEMQNLVDFTTPGTYTVWLRGCAIDTEGDSAHVDLASYSGIPQEQQVTGIVRRLAAVRRRQVA